MEVILAQSAGFCFGVERAVEKVYEQLESGKKIYTPMGRSSTMKKWSGIWKAAASV